MRVYQEALEEANHLFEGIFTTMQNGYYRVSADERVILANPAFIDILGLPRESNLTGKPIKELGYVDAQQRKKMLREVDAHQQVHLYESEWKRGDGTPISVLENIQRYANEDGELQYYEGTVQDITPLRILEQRLQLSQKMEVIGTGFTVLSQKGGLLLNVGFSHPVYIGAVDGITCEVEKGNTSFSVQGYNKYMVGQVSAKIRSIRPPEPFKGKGIRYKDEYVRRKAGKTVGK